MNPSDMRKLRASAKEACGLLGALAHEDRLMLLCRIAIGELSVGDLERSLDIRQPTLSQQLGVLRRHGMVETRREGRKVYYRLKSRRALAIMDALYVQFCGRGATAPAPRCPPAPRARRRLPRRSPSA
ncbi:MAG: metalloregulator ArsR/SmtB family transcription factor [Ramlibacter sp.]|nr:metalloregulator ArsR/SmtB family transcription factor [Ramlibacter sp.]